ncbi:hypothetical protein M885DRAFT_566448 [Pelagophyceae sp. CCMP2097]|nr:hypothetical protein M885DRAFT_566448 [Pelagophyceae sp. CCMP2097]
MLELWRRASLARLLPPVRRFAARGPAEADLYVRNLPSGATAVDVRRAFEAVCTVREVRVPVDGATGRPRGFAFVRLEAADCDAARRAMDGAKMGGRKIAPQRSGGKAAAIALNKQLVSSETAADVLSLFEAKGDAYDFMNIATSLHRLGKLSRSFEKSSAPLLHRLLERAASSIINEQWDPQGLANACWGIAKIGNVEAPALFEAVAAVAPKKIATFDSQNLANTVWAYATARIEAPALFEMIAAEAAKKIATFNPQNLANTLWAYATVGSAAPALFEAIAVEAPKKIATFNSQDLANTLRLL